MVCCIEREYVLLEEKTGHIYLELEKKWTQNCNAFKDQKFCA